MKHDHAFDLVDAVMLPDRAMDASGANATLGARWEAVCNAAQTAAAVGGIASNTGAACKVSRQLETLDPSRYEAAATSIDDLSLVMQIGLTALVGVQENGRDPAAAAETLWREFEVARDALGTMLEPA